VSRITVKLQYRSRRESQKVSSSNEFKNQTLPTPISLLFAAQPANMMDSAIVARDENYVTNEILLSCRCRLARDYLFSCKQPGSETESVCSYE
jgi:hypothetical protein